MRVGDEAWIARGAIRLLSPLHVGSRPAAWSQFGGWKPCHDTIPGTVLRGACGSMLRALTGADERFEQLFHHAEESWPPLVFRWARPACGEPGCTGMLARLPGSSVYCPLCRKPLDRGETCHGAWRPEYGCLACHEPQGSPVRGSYRTLRSSGSGWRVLQVIEEGQTFHFEVVSRDRDGLEAVRGSLQALQQSGLGGGKTLGLGRFEVSAWEVLPAAEQLGEVVGRLESGRRVIMRLLSPLLPSRECTSSDDMEDFVLASLGVRLDVALRAVRILSAEKEGCGGWSLRSDAQWDPVMSLRAGAEIEVIFADRVDPRILAHLQVLSGVGSRISGGYGEVAFESAV